jgi:transposase-like protein
MATAPKRDRRRPGAVARDTAKRTREAPAGSKQHRFSEEERAAAVALFAEVGATEAARQTGASARTVLRWAADAGVSSPEERRAQTEQARLEVERRRNEAHAQLAPMLTHVAQQAIAAQLELVTVVADIARSARENDGNVDARLLARLSALTAAVGELTPRSLVAMGTRAIHDLQLLTGGDTERGTAGEVRVFFAQLGADPDGEEPSIVDLEPLRLVEGGAS